MNSKAKFKHLIAFFSAILFLVAVSPVFAEEDPIVMLQSVTERVMAELKTHRHNVQSDPNKIYEVVDHLILPHVDFAEMARWVVGRNAWTRADAATKSDFIKAFKTMVVRSYSRALLEYTDQKIEFLPLRKAEKNKERIQVSSLIKEEGKSPIHMDYNLILENNHWQVYDIIIEGVSLVQGYRAQFADDIQQGGIGAVIGKMNQHNKDRR